MAIDFLDKLAVSQAEIPAAVSRMAGFFLVMQAIIIVFRKKNKPDQNIWEDISGVVLAGLIVYVFPELIKFIELLVNTMCHVEVKNSSEILEYVKDSTVGDATADGDTTTAEDIASLLIRIIAHLTLPSAVLGGATSGSYLFATAILKPLADIANTICFPTYWIIRAASLKIIYWIAPLVLVVGAIHPFRGLWKQWFMIYIALLVSGPALMLANDFLEDCFSMYIETTDSPTMGFFIIVLARFKVFQAVIDLCYRIFRV